MGQKNEIAYDLGLILSAFFNIIIPLIIREIQFEASNYA